MKHLLALAALLFSVNANAAPIYINESSCNTNSCTISVWLETKTPPGDNDGVHPYIESHFISFNLDRAVTFSFGPLIATAGYLDTIIDGYNLWHDSWKGPAPTILEAGMHSFGLAWIPYAKGDHISRTINFQYLSEVPAPAPLFLMIPALIGFSLLRIKSNRQRLLHHM
jgi:hypothetical protein